MISALVLLMGLGVASAGDERPSRVVGEASDLTLQPATYAGRLDRAPVPHWSARLPGRPVNAATHTERSRPLLVGEEIFVGSMGGEALYVLSRRDGTIIRSFPASASVNAEAVLHEDRVLFSDTSGTTWCYQLNGELVWKHEGGAPILVRPTVAGDRVITTNVDDLAVAVSLDTGELIWRYQRRPDALRKAELTLYAAPPAVVADTEVLLGFSDGSLVALALETGDVWWERQIGEGRYPDLVAAPIVLNDTLYASGFNLPFVSLNRQTRSVEWRGEFGAAAQPLIGSSTILDPATDTSAPILYHPGSDGRLRAINALTGERVWTFISGREGALTTPVETEAGLLVATGSGSLFLIDPLSGEALWEQRRDILLDGIAMAPAVDGRQIVFVTNAGRIYSLLAPRRWSLRPARTHRERRGMFPFGSSERDQATELDSAEP